MMSTCAWTDGSSSVRSCLGLYVVLVAPLIDYQLATFLLVLVHAAKGVSVMAYAQFWDPERAMCRARRRCGFPGRRASGGGLPGRARECCLSRGIETRELRVDERCRLELEMIYPSFLYCGRCCETLVFRIKKSGQGMTKLLTPWTCWRSLTRRWDHCQEVACHNVWANPLDR